MRQILIASVLSVVLAGAAWADAQGDLKQGRDALRRGDHAAAVASLTQAIDAGGLQGENLAEAYRLRGQAYFRTGDLDRAAADVRQALGRSASDAAALGLGCQISVAVGNLPAAEADLKAALAADPNSGAAQLCQAGLLTRQRKFAEAIAAFDKAIELGENAPDVRANRAIAVAMSGRPQDAVAALDKVLADAKSAAPAQRAEWLVDRARLHAATGNTDQAVKDLDEAIRLDPDNPRRQGERHFLRARLYSDAGRYDAALADLNIALTGDRNAPDGRRALLFATRGSVYAEQGDFQRAIADIDGAISLGKDVPPPVVASWYATRARANRAAGRPDMALQDYDRALGMAPGDVGILGERGDLRLRQGQVDAAMADFQAAAQQAPNEPLPLSWIAWAHAEKGDYAKAAETASRVVQMRPQDPLGHWDRGVFRFFLGRFDEAAADLDKVVELTPRNAGAVLLAHVARARAGEGRQDLLAERARALDLSRWPGPLIRMFLGEVTPEQALQAVPEQRLNVEAYFYAGEYRLLNGDRDKAVELFQKAVDTNARNYMEHMAAWIELYRIKA